VIVDSQAAAEAEQARAVEDAGQAGAFERDQEREWDDEGDSMVL
jgi:hypothetical protein